MAKQGCNPSLKRINLLKLPPDFKRLVFRFNAEDILRDLIAFKPNKIFIRDLFTQCTVLNRFSQPFIEGFKKNLLTGFVQKTSIGRIVKMFGLDFSLVD